MAPARRIRFGRVPATALAAALLGAAAARAQSGSVVVPQQFATQDAPGLALWPFGAFDARRQLLVDQRLLGAAAGRPLVALGVRRNAGDREPVAAARVELRVELSAARGRARTAVAEFARNRGQHPTTVFAGVVDLPASPAPTGATPAWTAPDAVTLPFATPFALHGAALCIETVTRPYVDPRTGLADDAWWPVDALVRPRGGTVTTLGTSCATGLGPRPAQAVGSTWLPGGAGVFALEGAHPGGLATCLIGFSDRLFGVQPLPVALAPLGAPGCELHVDPVLAAPGALVPFGAGSRAAARVALVFPDNAAVVGRDVYAQWLLPEPGANALGLTTSNGVRATLGAQAPDDGFVWIESTDLASPTGRVLTGRMPVLRIEHH